MYGGFNHMYPYPLKCTMIKCYTIYFVHQILICALKMPKTKQSNGRDSGGQPQQQQQQQHVYTSLNERYENGFTIQWAIVPSVYYVCVAHFRYGYVFGGADVSSTTQI